MKGDFFHIVNRGVEERKIFFSEKDRIRFAHNLYDFNTTDRVLPYSQRSEKRFGRRTSKYIFGRPTSKSMSEEKLVDLLCWCEMPNHSHNFVQARIDGGASRFSQKVFGGYTKYINEKYGRQGVLFQGKSKIIKVKRDAHFYYLPFYIMSNPIALIEPNWKERGIKNPKKVMNFLEKYRFSSFLDLIGKENFPLLINKRLFYKLFETNEKKFKKDFFEWIKSYKKGYDFGNFVD